MRPFWLSSRALGGGRWRDGRPVIGVNYLTEKVIIGNEQCYWMKPAYETS